MTDRKIHLRFWLYHAGIPFILLLLVIVVFEFTSLDIRINNLFYDSVAKRFPLRHDWFLEAIMHGWTKYLVVIFTLCVFAVFLLSLGLSSLKRFRRVSLFVVLAMSMGPAVVGVMKATTNKHCPYDLTIYGGEQPYAGLLDAREGSVRGKCFPGGHASGGFALMSLYFAWFMRNRKLAWLALGFGFAYGFAMGWGRMIQGAHFLSHNLWSAIICWYVALLFYALLLKKSDFNQSAG